MSASQFIQAVDVARNLNGYWSHPDMPDFDEAYQAFRAWLEAQGLTVSVSRLESEDEDHPTYISYFDKSNPGVLQWTPESPDGAGWFTLSIHDTEDGPVWVWVQRVTDAGEVPE